MQRLGTVLVFALTVLAATPVREATASSSASGRKGWSSTSPHSRSPARRPRGIRPPRRSTDPDGQGFVLDVQGGQALVGVVPGTGVQVNDLVVLCPPRDSGDGDQIRALVDGIRAQAASPQVLATAARLQSVLDARSAALLQGNCDVARFDQETQGLLAQLQSEAAAAQTASSTVTGYPAPASSPPAGGIRRRAQRTRRPLARAAIRRPGLPTPRPRPRRAMASQAPVEGPREPQVSRATSSTAPRAARTCSPSSR